MMMQKTRLQSLQNILRQHKLDALLITSQPNIYYLTGIPPMPDTNELTALATKNELYIFVRSTYFEAAKKLALLGTVLEVRSDLDTSEVADGTPRGWSYKDNLYNHLKFLIKKYGISSIGFEATDITVSRLTSLKSQISKIKISWKATKNLIGKLRQIKDKTEIAYIKQAAKVTDEAFSFILDKIKPGKKEKDIALEIEMYLKTNSDGIAFSPIVASGGNSANPHYISGEKKIKRGEMVLLDFGAKVKGYCADMTRVVFLGKADKKFKDVYQTVLKAQKKTINFLRSGIGTNLRSGISTRKVDAIARKFIKKSGYPDIPHGVGHALGIDIHEKPTLSPKDKEMLKAGMVFTIEPGIYLDGWGGVRIEDLVALKEDSIEILSRSAKNILEY